MALIKNWGYGETQWGGSDGRYEARFVGRMNKSTFIRTVLGRYRQGAKWIEDRMSETRNTFALQLITKYPDKVVMYNDRTHAIVKILDKLEPNKQ